MLTVFQVNKSITIKWGCGKQSRAILFYGESNSRILPPRQSKVWENCKCAVRLQFFVCIMLVKSKDSVKMEQSGLNHVLTEGELLYKSLNVVDMLTADDLPRSIVMCNIEFPVDFLELKTEIAHLRNGERFLRRSIPNTGDEFMLLLFIGGFTTALMKHHNDFYLFDSHG